MTRVTFVAGLLAGLTIGLCSCGPCGGRISPESLAALSLRVDSIEARSERIERDLLRIGSEWLQAQTIVLDSCDNPKKLR